MDAFKTLSLSELMAFLQKAQSAKASVSLRPVGSNRILGDLHLRGMEAGNSLHLLGAKRRDHLPAAGSAVTVSLLLEDEVVSFEALVLEPIVATEGDTLFPPIVRVGWPSEGARFQNRSDLRVASPIHRSLEASVTLASGERLRAHIVNLTETGMGLAMAGDFRETIPMTVTVEAQLPGGDAWTGHGQIRHVSLLEGAEPLPVRLGLVLDGEPSEALKRFLQNRRTDVSEDFKKLGR